MLLDRLERVHNAACSEPFPRGYLHCTQAPKTEEATKEDTLTKNQGTVCVCVCNVCNVCVSVYGLGGSPRV